MPLLAPDNHPVFSFEFHDSEVRQIRADGSALTIDFSAAFVRRADGAVGYVQTLQMQLVQASWTSATSSLLTSAIGRLSSGRLRSADVQPARIALPSHATGPLQLQLQFSNGSALQIDASALVCRFLGDPQFRESLAC